MAEFTVAATPVSDPSVQAEADANYQQVYRFWTPRADAYEGVGPTYVDDPQMRASFDKIAVGLAVYQRDAMTVYADARLSGPYAPRNRAAGLAVGLAFGRSAAVLGSSGPSGAAVGSSRFIGRSEGMVLARPGGAQTRLASRCRAGAGGRGVRGRTP
ncbi:TipAS antibiotic-recognition domain-containing protein [Streptomyces sp. NPDC055099]